MKKDPGGKPKKQNLPQKDYFSLETVHGALP
jgi:hypothetical protein